MAEVIMTGLFALLCAVGLAQSEPYAGTWSDGTLQLTLEPGAQGYVGSATLGGQVYQVQAIDQGNGLQGVAVSGFEQAGFVAGIQQGALVVMMVSDGTTYFLKNSAAAATEQQQALARGPHAVLTAADIEAFHEALIFCLAYAGVKDAKASLPPDQVRSALIASFPRLSPEEQQGIANADILWPTVRAGWAQMPVAEQQAFVRDVLALAFGRQADKYGGSAGQGASSDYGSLPSVDTSGTGLDCWASAGCVDYEPSSNTYTYEDYDYGSGTVDYSYE